MDLYTVDANWLKTNVIDEFISLVWTERYNDSGDVTLTLPDTTENRALVTEGIFLHTPQSKEIMLVDSISVEGKVITAKGFTLTDFLKQRMFRKGWATSIDSWVTGGTLSPGGTIVYFMQQFFNPGTFLTNGNVLTSAQGTNEVFPNVTYSPALAGSGLLMSVPYGTLFDCIKTVADTDAIGFRMYPTDMTAGNGAVYFEHYKGLDRSSSQSTNPVVIFDSAMDALADSTEVRSINGYKNVAYVFPGGATAQTQIVQVYAPGVASTISAWARRTLMVDATDLNAPDYTAATLTTILTQRGLDALANNNYVKLSDGRIVPQLAYTYGTDYNLGDVIELRGPSSTSQKARITEYIRAQDPTGERAYPTLSVIG